MPADDVPAMHDSMPREIPWHRQRWPWLLMLGPGIVVVAGIITLWLAVASDDGLVADDYYKRGLAINRTLARADRAAELGMAATVDVDSAGRARVALRARDRAALPVAIRLAVLHPTRAGADHRAVLVRGPDGDYVGSIAPLTSGRWLVAVETDDWRLPIVEVDGLVRAVRVTSGAR
ncbi:MAG: FixH family protein [Burkholderiales bacterium]|nr:FixH family protein [Burkholderiales bacterium]